MVELNMYGRALLKTSKDDLKEVDSLHFTEYRFSQGMKDINVTLKGKFTDFQYSNML